ncbi:hypothetical protein NMD95_17215 (plasmid) [Edwardsiella tarda]
MIKYKINLILQEDEYKRRGELLNESGFKLENVFFDLVRPMSGCNSDRYFEVKEKNKKNKKPIVYKSLPNAIRDEFYQSCHTGKLSISVDGLASSCPWDKDKHTLMLDDEKFGMKLNNKWLNPIANNFIYCKSCEFSHLCFNCPSLNKNDEFNKRPSNCNYNPFSGVTEND